MQAKASIVNEKKTKDSLGVLGKTGNDHFLKKRIHLTFPCEIYPHIDLADYKLQKKQYAAPQRVFYVSYN